MSSLRGVETFGFLVKHTNAQKKKRRKVIRVAVIIVVVLILLIGSAALLKSFVIDKNSNGSTGPPSKQNDTAISIGQFMQYSKSTVKSVSKKGLNFNV